jgi:hypothetical protein
VMSDLTRSLNVKRSIAFSFDAAKSQRSGRGESRSAARTPGSACEFRRSTGTVRNFV